MYEPHWRLHELNPHDHLHHFYHLCITHFKWNILTLRSQVSKDVYNAMWSLVSTEGHPDIAKTLNTIQQGNHKAKGALSFVLKHLTLIIDNSMVEKQRDGKICLACNILTNEFDTSLHMESLAIHHEWKKQAHRNVNWDGINLTLLAGIMCGYQYDVRAMSSIDLHITHGIVNRDREATHMHCAKRAVGHHGE